MPAALRSTRSSSGMQTGIKAFGVAKKPGVALLDEKKKALSAPTRAASKKRKFDDETEVAEPQGAIKRGKTSASSSPATSFLDTEASSPAASFSSVSTAPAQGARPDPYYDLIDLHSATLKALSLLYAHNGTSVPVDMANLLSGMEKIWKKRKVAKEDIQRILPIMEGKRASSNEKSTATTQFRLVNYGQGKFVLEKLGEQNGGATFPFNESKLQEEFALRLEDHWCDRLRLLTEGTESDVDVMKSLPLARIVDATTSSPFLKSLQRWEMLSATARARTKAQADGQANNTMAQEEKQTAGVNKRRRALFERIKSKEDEKSKLPPPPSKETLVCRAAAGRIPEVARVLLMLRPSSDGTKMKKQPHRFVSVIENIRDSIPTPISREEAEMCLEIMARPSVAGDWVNIVKLGALKAVVLKSGRCVSAQEITERVLEQKIGE